ncbi:unnamed protein product, partial [Medioppia subpectinata]
MKNAGKIAMFELDYVHIHSMSLVTNGLGDKWLRDISKETANIKSFSVKECIFSSETKITDEWQRRFQTANTINELISGVSGKYLSSKIGEELADRKADRVLAFGGRVAERHTNQAHCLAGKGLGFCVFQFQAFKHVDRQLFAKEVQNFAVSVVESDLSFGYRVIHFFANLAIQSGYHFLSVDHRFIGFAARETKPAVGSHLHQRKGEASPRVAAPEEYMSRIGDNNGKLIIMDLYLLQFIPIVEKWGHLHFMCGSVVAEDMPSPKRNPISLLVSVKTSQPRVADYWLTVPAAVLTIDDLKRHLMSTLAIDGHNEVDLWLDNGLLRDGRTPVGHILINRDHLEVRPANADHYPVIPAIVSADEVDRSDAESTDSRTTYTVTSRQIEEQMNSS